MRGPGGRGALRLVLFGAPGVGKGTQAVEMHRRTGIPHISTGDMLRAAMQAGSALGETVRGVVESGGLVPDAVVGDVVRERLGRPDVREGFLLDGFPRTLVQADILDDVLVHSGVRLDRVINIELPEPEIIDRLSGRRSCGTCGATFHVRFKRPRQEDICDTCGGRLGHRRDDSAAAIHERLRVYHERTAPLIARYDRAGLLLTVDGHGTPDEVYGRIADALPALKG